MALMLSSEFGCTIANPPETVITSILAKLKQRCGLCWLDRHTEELLATTALLDDLDESGLQLLNGRYVVGKDTHLSGLSGDVDLDDIL